MNTMQQYTEIISHMLSSVGMSGEQIAIVLFQLDQEVTQAITTAYTSRMTENTREKLYSLPESASAQELGDILGITKEDVAQMSTEYVKQYIEKLEQNLPKLKETLQNLTNPN